MDSSNYPTITLASDVTSTSNKQTKVEVQNYRIVTFLHTDGLDYFIVQKHHNSKWRNVLTCDAFGSSWVKAYPKFEHAFIVLADRLRQEV